MGDIYKVYGLVCNSKPHIRAVNINNNLPSPINISLGLVGRGLLATCSLLSLEISNTFEKYMFYL